MIQLYKSATQQKIPKDFKQGYKKIFGIYNYFIIERPGAAKEELCRVTINPHSVS